MMKQPNSTPPNFNTEAFLRGFRAACAQRGIDPEEGATSFQVVHVLIEQAKAARQARRTARWWRRHPLWRECEPYHSDVEEEAIWNLFIEAYSREMKRIVRAKRRRQAAMPLRERLLLRERLPLREVHRLQREGLPLREHEKNE